MITEADIERAVIGAFRAVFARLDQFTEGGNIARPAPVKAAILPPKVSKRRDPWEEV